MGSSEPAWYMGEAGAVRSWAGFLSSLNLSLLTCKVGGSNQRVLKTLVQPWIRNAHGHQLEDCPSVSQCGAKRNQGQGCLGFKGQSGRGTED